MNIFKVLGDLSEALKAKPAKVPTAPAPAPLSQPPVVGSAAALKAFPPKSKSNAPSTGTSPVPPVRQNRTTQSVALRREDIAPTVLPLPPLSDSQSAALAIAMNESRPFVFITGKAGTGKSMLIRHLARITGTVICAPTGIAALNAGGATAHSLFKVKPGFLDPKHPDYVPVPICSSIRQLVLDEVSMMRADLIDRIDATLRYNRDSNLPFGGVRVVAVGDCYQLPPVVTDQDRPLIEMRYQSPWWFDAQVFKNLQVEMVELTEVFRQRDEGFISFLNRVRVNDLPSSWIDRINERCFQSSNRQDDDLVLTTTRKAAEAINETRFSKLTTPVQEYVAEITGEFLKEREESHPVPARLRLRVGANVVVTKNSSSVPNGTLGEVVALGEKTVSIRVKGFDKPIDLLPAQWEKTAYRVGGGRIEQQTVGTFTQIPLLLGWAITIHKCQGLTLARGCVDLGAGAFAPGQAYVAMSRVASLEGLSLRRPLTARDVYVDPRVAQITRMMRAATEF